ncbi:carbonic anhydrase [Cadophora sp. MPI-SDFR-AT-0126]|nr:carbonic anhydrase [Leotiomycetes sp. MPI-SDFR-AT-0126]
MGSNKRNTFEYALKSNEAWANYKGHQNPAFFEKLATGQSPSILWLGCSDSRVPETTLLGLQPGDVFVHRNIANIISPTDINSMAVIEYAVVHLKVQHIVLCGHTCCGGAGAALGDGRVGGVIDAWITPLRMLRKNNEVELKALRDDGKKAVRLAELNVEMGVGNLMSSWFVEEAIRDRGLTVHGVLYDVACGKIRDLHVGTTGKEGYPGSSTQEQLGEIVKGNHGMLVFSGDVATMAMR